MCRPASFILAGGEGTLSYPTTVPMATHSAPFSRLKTQGLAGYNLAWSPFYPDKLAVAGAANVSALGGRSVGPGSAEADGGLRSTAWWEMAA